NIRRMFVRLMFGRWITPINANRERMKTNERTSHSFISDNSFKTEGQISSNSRRAGKVFIPSPLSFMEKLEVLYLSPYYLQAFFFIIGTMSWLVSDAVFKVRLPFWTELWGWSLVLTNLFSLPLMNAVGMFLEEAEEKDYIGLLSFTLLCYILVPFQAYASVKGFLKKDEGPWFRTPKTGKVTDVFTRGRFYRWVSGVIPGRFAPVTQIKANFGRINANARIGHSLIGSDSLDVRSHSRYLALASANNRFQGFKVRRKRLRWASKVALTMLLVASLTLLSLTRGYSEVLADPDLAETQYLTNDTTATLSNSWVLSASADTVPGGGDSSTSLTLVKGVNPTDRYAYEPGITDGTTPETDCADDAATGKGWILDTAFQVGGTVASGDWVFTMYEDDTGSGGVQPIGTLEVCAYRITVGAGSVTDSFLIFDTLGMAGWSTADILDQTSNNPTYTASSISEVTFSANDYLFIQYSLNVTGIAKDINSIFATGDIGATNPRITFPTLTIPENLAYFMAAAPLIPLVVMWMKKRYQIIK
ncbi:hypothetical protein ACFL0Y_04730, partial [Patescibacteria group bacterium]